MGRKLFVICVAVAVVVSFALPSIAITNDRLTTKLNRGGKKIISSPLEIPKAIMQTTKESNIIFGVLFGPLRGVCNFFSKVTSGTADVVGCNVGDEKEEFLKPQMISEGSK